MAIHSPVDLNDRLNSVQKLEDWEDLLSDMGYDITDDPVHQAGWPDRIKESVERARIIAESGQFKVIFITTKSASQTIQRSISLALQRNGYPHHIALFVSEADASAWHLVSLASDTERRRRAVLRRFTIEPGFVRRTTSEQLLLLNVRSADSVPAIQGKVDAAFSVEEVTKRFYQAYEETFANLREEFSIRGVPGELANEGSQRLLNRLMFLYFVQAKGWMRCGDRNPKNFLKEYVRAFARVEDARANTDYHEHWLQALFFHGLNRESLTETAKGSIPREQQGWLEGLPYLNGGLFRRDDLDEVISERKAFLPFRVLKRVHEDLLERFNFTISEDSSWETEVAVDPEMLGRVYESFVLREERGEAGIFYTQRAEIEMMTRLPLFKYIVRQLGFAATDPRYTAVSRLVLDLPEEDELEEVGRAFGDEDLHRIQALLNDLTVCDPACGSGAFLVGMLTLLRELHVRLHHLKDVSPPNDFKLKKQIIEKNLYGGELKAWAAEISRLRMWLSLVVDGRLEDFPPDEPILPSLHFKIGVGDSLVQTIADQHINLRAARVNAPGDELTARLDALTKAKHAFYENEYQGSPAQQHARILELERQVFAFFLDKEIERLDTRYKRISGQTTLFGGGQSKLTYSQGREQKLLNERLDMLKRVREGLPNAQDLRFVWDITFAEVMLRRGGFDIVVGNPPYLRMEDAYVQEGYRDTKEYHAAVMEAIYAEWPDNAVDDEFRGHTIGALARNWQKIATKASPNGNWPLVFDGKSDLSLYFILKAISLLRPQGQMCFITTNSWLDVEYGGPLRSHLASTTELHALIESATVRSFGQAAINTVILLVGRPDSPLTPAELQQRQTQFASYRVGFDVGFSSDSYLDIERASGAQDSGAFKVVGVDQLTLYLRGTSARQTDGSVRLPHKDMNPLALPHTGELWGSLYFRAPTIFWQLLQNDSAKLVRLGGIANVRFGIKTGCNEFFYASNTMPPVNGYGERVSIESRFLLPVIKSPKSVKGWVVRPEEVDTVLIRLPREEHELSAAAKAYIKAGEKRRVEVKKGSAKGSFIVGIQNLASLQGRNPWYTIDGFTPTRIMFHQAYGGKLRVIFSEEESAVDARLYQCITDVDEELLAAVLNSTLSLLQVELYGRVNFGDGALDLKVGEAEDILIPKLNLLETRRDSIVAAYQKMAQRPPMEFWEEVQQSDRHELDKAILGACGMDWALDELIDKAGVPTRLRIERAGSTEAPR